MRGIAEFAMRSRWHAIGTSMVAAVLPFLGWLSTVVVALVCLRHGVAAGSVVLLWTLLPVGMALYYVGDPSPAIALMGTFLMAVLLRQSFSWELVLLACVGLAAVGTLVFEFTASGILERFVSFYIDYLARVDASITVTPVEAQKLLLGFFSLGQAYAMVVMLIIARWCQSALYNPEGFKKEFHQLRLSPVVSMALLLAMLACYVFMEQLGRWLPLLTVPLLFASLGLAHWIVAARGMSKNWIAGLYVSLVLVFQLIYPFLASVALMDSWFNIRNRIQMIQKD
jgi:hypothetical protein